MDFKQLSECGGVGSPTSQVGNKIHKDQLSVGSVFADLFLGCIKYFPDLSVVIDPPNQIGCLTHHMLHQLIVFEIISKCELELQIIGLSTKSV